jgi:hypothetical protein
MWKGAPAMASHFSDGRFRVSEQHPERLEALAAVVPEYVPSQISLEPFVGDLVIHAIGCVAAGSADVHGTS